MSANLAAEHDESQRPFTPQFLGMARCSPTSLPSTTSLSGPSLRSS